MATIALAGLVSASVFSASSCKNTLSVNRRSLPATGLASNTVTGAAGLALPLADGDGRRCRGPGRRTGGRGR